MLTLPSSLNKGEELVFALNKTQAVAAATDVWFQDVNNIRRAFVVYRSTIGNQRKTLEFDFAEASPTAKATWSARSRDSYTVEQIVLEDKDGDVHPIPSSAFPAGKDVSFGSVQVPAIIENYRPNNTVYASLMDGSTLYIGGGFTQIRYTARHVAVIDPATAANAQKDLGSTFPVVDNGDILCVEFDGANVMYIGGTFTHVGGVSCSRFARLVKSSGEWIVDTAFTAEGKNQPFDGSSVQCIKVSGDYLYIGGNWDTWRNGAGTQVSSPCYIKISKVDGSVAATSGLTYTATRVTHDIKISGDELYVCGTWGMTKTNKNTGAAIGTVDFFASFISGYVLRTILLTNDHVYVGGYFLHSSGNRNVIKLNRSTMAVDSTFVTPFSLSDTSNVVYSLVQTPDGHIVAGGMFNNLTTTGRNIVKLNSANGSRVSEFNAGSLCYFNGNTAYVRGLLLIGSSLYAAGRFNGRSVVGDPDRNLCVTKLDAITGAKDEAFLSQANRLSSAELFNGLAQYGSNIMVFGFVDGYGGFRRSGIARFNKDAAGAWKIDETFGDGDNGGLPVFCLLKTGTSLYVGGGFNTFMGAGRARIAMIDTATGLLSNFAVGQYPTGRFNGFNSTVYDMVLDGSELIVGGSFTTISYKNSATTFTTTSANRIAKVNISTNEFTTYVAGANSNVQSIESDGTNLYVTGLFTQWAGAANTHGLVKISKSNFTVAPGWSLALAGANRYSARLYDGKLFVGGVQISSTAGGLAVVDPSSGAVIRQYTDVELGAKSKTFNTSVDFDADATHIYVVTGYNNSNTDWQYSLRRISRATLDIDPSWGIKTSASATNTTGFATLALVGNEIIVGGNFTSNRDNTMPPEFRNQGLHVFDKTTAVRKENI